MALEFQKEIRKNAIEMQSYLKDLDDWKQEVSKKERKSNATVDYPIRGKQTTDSSNQKNSTDNDPKAPKIEQIQLQSKGEPSHNQNNDPNRPGDSKSGGNVFNTQTELDGRYNICRIKKIEANDAFRAKEYKKAAIIYASIIKLFQEAQFLENEPQNKELETFYVSIYSNLVQCEFIRKDYSQVIKLSKIALSLDPRHIKSCYRLGRAFKCVKDYKNCAYYLNKGLNLCTDESEKKEFSDEIIQLEILKQQLVKDFKNSLVLPVVVSSKPKFKVKIGNYEEEEEYTEQAGDERTSENSNEKGFEYYFKERVQASEPSSEYLNLKNIEAVAQKYSGLAYRRPGDKNSAKVSFKPEFERARLPLDPDTYEGLE